MLQPLNRYLVVNPLEEKEQESSHVLIPDDIKIDISKFKLVVLLAAHADSNLKKGIRLVVPTHMIEEAVFSDKKYYLVLENHVVGFLEEKIK